MFCSSQEQTSLMGQTTPRCLGPEVGKGATLHWRGACGLIQTLGTV